jgi:hypothetical protein
MNTESYWKSAPPDYCSISSRCVVKMIIFPFVSLYQRQSLQSYRYAYDVKFTLLQTTKREHKERECPDKLNLS